MYIYNKQERKEIVTLLNTRLDILYKAMFDKSDLFTKQLKTTHPTLSDKILTAIRNLPFVHTNWIEDDSINVSMCKISKMADFYYGDAFRLTLKSEGDNTHYINLCITETLSGCDFELYEDMKVIVDIIYSIKRLVDIIEQEGELIPELMMIQPSHINIIARRWEEYKDKL